MGTDDAGASAAFDRFFGAESQGPYLPDDRAVWSDTFEELVQMSKREALRPGSFRVLELQRDATGDQIAELLPKGQSSSLTDIAYLLARHSAGEAIPLHAGGWANLFIVGGRKPLIVHAFFAHHNRGWSFETLPLTSNMRWMKGVRVFSRSDEHSLSKSDLDK